MDAGVNFIYMNDIYACDLIFERFLYVCVCVTRLFENFSAYTFFFTIFPSDILYKLGIYLFTGWSNFKTRTKVCDKRIASPCKSIKLFFKKYSKKKIFILF